ncbi:MAG: ABC transporter ATP-binding protein [Candidatus Adiutrix sp.]|jgi:taurine transport system ATP-binding protein|nr:ABC transporter ATP-binding protein [Candidatus Adiutrix sp.]
MEEREAHINYPFVVTDELIAMEDVGYRYGKAPHDRAAIEHVNFNIFPRELVCLMGPSGCGKSTLLKIIAGFIRPTEGKVKLSQVEISGIDWHRGVVFQQPPLFEWFSVRKNIAFGPKVRKVPQARIDEMVDDYLERVGLTEFADQKVFELSGGMRQRVAIARSLINNPKILLMDEPFSALDALTREQMQDLVRKIWWNTRKTILFITHDVDEALKLGSRVLVMSRHPGTIAREIGLNFSNDFIQSGDDRIWFSDDFYSKRREILSLIGGRA